jgi:hypothetical protein
MSGEIPVRSVLEDGTIIWMLPNGDLHREDGPATIRPDGTEYWYLNGLSHREGAPAIQCSDGSRTWVVYDKTHREDGPAVEWFNGKKEWWLYGFRQKLTEELKISHPVLYDQMLIYEVMEK